MTKKFRLKCNFNIPQCGTVKNIGHLTKISNPALVTCVHIRKHLPLGPCYVSPLTQLSFLFSPLSFITYTGPTVSWNRKEKGKHTTLARAVGAEASELPWRQHWGMGFLGAWCSSAKAAQSPGKWVFLSPLLNTKIKSQEVTSLFITHRNHSEGSKQALWLLCSYHTQSVSSIWV